MNAFGFTGTQAGMTVKQNRGVDRLLGLISKTGDFVLHGDCIGADAEFDAIAASYGLARWCYPCTIESKRAYTDAHAAAPAPPLERNRRIVTECDTLIVAPKGFEEERRSGTWATYRYARSIGRRLHIVWPDGRVSLGTP